MKTALIIGNGQIGSEIAAQLVSAGIAVRIATRSGGSPQARTDDPASQLGAANGAASASGEASPIERASANGAASLGHLASAEPEPTHIRADATDPRQLMAAAEGADVIFACAHAPYDSRRWATVLPRLDSAVLETAADLGVPVVFPESVYAFAGLGRPLTESSPFAPVEEKGRIRQSLLEARAAHRATSASVIAGDLLGRTAQRWASVVRMCITEPILRGRRPFVPARTDVAHGITVIADQAAAMIRAAELLAGQPAGTHRILLAPASNPTLGEIAEFTAAHLGRRPKRPVSLPRWSMRVAGAFERSFYELNQLAPIWYSPCIIEPGDFADSLGTTDWREGVRQML